MLDVSGYKKSSIITLFQNDFIKWQILTIWKDYDRRAGINQYAVFFKGREQICNDITRKAKFFAR